MTLTDPADIKALLQRHGFRFSKAMGQNFLINPSVCPRMAEACGAAPGRGVLEIGPGIGVLTEQLAMRAKKVVAVELDRRLLPVLAETLSAYPCVEIVEGDILKLDLPRLLRRKIRVPAGFGMRQSPLLHHLSHCDDAAGKPAAHRQPDRYGAEGGGPASLVPVPVPGKRVPSPWRYSTTPSRRFFFPSPGAVFSPRLTWTAPSSA